MAREFDISQQNFFDVSYCKNKGRVLFPLAFKWHSIRAHLFASQAQNGNNGNDSNDGKSAAAIQRSFTLIVEQQLQKFRLQLLRSQGRLCPTCPFFSSLRQAHIWWWLKRHSAQLNFKHINHFLLWQISHCKKSIALLVLHSADQTKNGEIC